MKKRISRIVAFFVIILMIPVIFLALEAKTPKVYGESYYAELPELYERLKEAPGKRIILIGGSNLAFGVDTVLLENTLKEKGFDYTVCLFGLYGAFGNSVMLDLAEDVLRDGDIVILSFEPDSSAMTDYFGATAFLKAGENNPSLITKLNLDHFDAAIGNYITYLHEKYDIVSSGTGLKLDNVYQKAAFDENCNMIYPREYNIMTLGYDPASPVNLGSLQISDAFSEEVIEFHNEAEKKGAKVYYSFCPVDASSVALSDTEDATLESDLLAYYTNCFEAFGCRIISEPSKYVMESGWFYDSNFHLNEAGSKLRTKYLAEDILAELGCFTDAAIALPSMPVTPAKDVEDSVDTGFFEFAETEEGTAYNINGVTAEGKSQTALTLPASYNGKPVVGFYTQTFADCSKLQELRLPSSIINIPDNAFTGCRSLERLILEHTESPCKISESSLTGCEKLKILVPADSYAMYRDGFGCDVNLWADYISQIYTY